MSLKAVWIIIIAGLPLIVLGLRRFAPTGKLVRFMTPRFLSRSEHTKVELRQAGVGWILWSAWLFLIPIAAISKVPFNWLESNRIVMAATFFVVPVTAVILQIAGWMLLIQGLTARTEQTSPLMNSIFAADPRKLAAYIKRMWHYARISMTALALTIVVPVTEAFLEVEPTGKVVLVNVFFLITFILTLWRTRAYVVKSSIAMSQCGMQALYSTLGGPASIFFVWYNAYQVRQQYLRGDFRVANRSAGSASVIPPPH